MKKIFFLLLTIVFLIGCSKKSTTQRSNNTVTAYSYQSLRGDAVFSRIVPDNNYAALEDIHLYAWTQDGGVNVNRVVLDFNTADIAQHTKIKHAYLNLYFNTTSKYDATLGGQGNKGEVDFIIEEITSDWNEKTVTWNTQPDIDMQKRVTVKKKENPRTDYLKLDVTDLLQHMVDKPVDKRFGLRLKLANEIPYNVYFFASGNHPNAAIRPALEIVY